MSAHPTLPDSDLLRSFLQLQSSSYLGIVIADLSRFVQMNDTFLKMIGVRREDTVPNGLDWHELTPAEFTKADENALEQLRVHGAFPPYEKAFTHKDGRAVPVVVAGMRLAEEPLKWAAYVMEINLGRRLEEVEAASKELEKKNRNLMEQAQRLSNPLTVIQGFLDVVAKDATAHEEVKGLLDPARRALEKATAAAREMK